MSKLPDFEGLAMFAKVAEERSFAGAARSVGVSVTTVSRAVARLEERLGARLLNRTSRKLALTEFGQLVAESATKIYREAEAAEGAALEMSSSPRGLIRLSVPMSFGLRWIAPLLPMFFRQYPNISIDLHLDDVQADLVGQGFDAALRIAVLPDSSLVARQLCPVSPLVVASPAYLEQHGVPQHPSELSNHACFGYAYRARADIWRFTNRSGQEVNVKPEGPLRVTNVDALLPSVIAGLGIAEFPEFVCADQLRAGSLTPILKDWTLPRAGLYFVTPSARSRPTKIDALSDFFSTHLSNPSWSVVEWL